MKSDGMVDGTVPESSNVSQNLIEVFLQDLQVAGKSPVTLQHYRDRLVEFGRFAKGQIGAVDIDQVRRFLRGIRWRKSENYNLSASALRSFIKWAYRTDRIPVDFTEKIELRPKSKTGVVLLSPEDIKKLLGVCNEFKQRLAISFLAETGIRRGRQKLVRREFCGLAWSDFNFDDRLVEVKGKGPGTDGRPRQVKFSEKLAEMLLRYKKMRGEMPLFSMRELPRVIREIASRAGIQKLAKARHPVHLFKHYYCTYWLITRRKAKLPEDLRSLSDQVGTSIATLESTYLHIASQHLKSSYDETARLMEAS